MVVFQILRGFMFGRVVCLVACIFCTAGFANIEKYYRKVEGKSEINRAGNVDFIYMINLDGRPEKYLRAAGALNAYGIYPYRFSAANGWDLTLAQINDIGLKFKSGMKEGMKAIRYPMDKNFKTVKEKTGKVGQSYFSPEVTRGAIGILISHLSILQDAYDSGYETIWVFEDDIDVVKDPRLMFERIAQLDAKVGANNWDFLFTDVDSQDPDGNYIPCTMYGKKPNYTPLDPKRYKVRKKINDLFQVVGVRYGAYSMIVRRSGMKKMLDYVKTTGVFLPYDIEYCLPRGIKMYTVLDDIVKHQAHALTDNKAPGYKKK